MYREPGAQNTGLKVQRVKNLEGTNRLKRQNAPLLRVARVEYSPLAEAELRARLFRAFDLLGMRHDILPPLPERGQALICRKGTDEEVTPLAIPS